MPHGAHRFCRHGRPYFTLDNDSTIPVWWFAQACFDKVLLTEATGRAYCRACGRPVAHEVASGYGT